MISNALLIERISAFVAKHMAGHDPSHNARHVSRVVRLAQTILEEEKTRNPSITYDETVVTLAAWMHDIADRKYLPKPTDGASKINPNTIIYDTLISHHADQSIAQKVQTIVSNVSYSTEIKDPSAVQRLISPEDGYPELAIVQDADRLDAIGAVGIARCFTFFGARSKSTGKEGDKEPDLDDAIEHFNDKLVKLEGMMKTVTGREMARERAFRIEEFQRWWADETNGV
ncbi:HD superfamily hydrolase [Trichophyton violaceum]|uniref:HD superfamily hydrolase n=1 Tax=Trichophyton violaceum TaxID=34388 RepID=A0A178FGI6_TRIVO|nr:HD superfamily hydrolase [Trichophyton violaceum]